MLLLHVHNIELDCALGLHPDREVEPVCVALRVNVALEDQVILGDFRRFFGREHCKQIGALELGIELNAVPITFRLLSDELGQRLGFEILQQVGAIVVEEGEVDQVGGEQVGVVVTAATHLQFVLLEAFGVELSD